MRARRPKRKAIALYALVPVLALGAGCGGDGDGNSGLSGTDKLAVLHARADIAEYCTGTKGAGGPNVLTDRSLGVMLDGVKALARVYREQGADTKIEIPAEKKSLTVEQVTREQIAALRKCGRYGRQQAGVLQAVIEQRAQS
jgi:hypothetical protein